MAPVQSVVPEVTIPSEVLPENVTTHIIDTSASSEYREKLDSELQKTNVICLVYSISDRLSFSRIGKFWLPMIRMQGINVPVILVGNKSDQRSILPPESTVQSSEVLQLMSENREIETCLECSAKDMFNITELFYFAQKAVLHPSRLLYDTSTHTMKPKCIQALNRVFWLCDLDGDDVLNSNELNNFQVTFYYIFYTKLATIKCFNISLNERELNDIVTAVRDSLPEGITNGGINLNGFLQLHKLFIQQGRAETTWSVLRKYGYGQDLTLSEDILYPDVEVDSNCCVELSADGFEFITELFRRFDRDKDASLNETELKKLFCVLPVSSPWSEYNFPHCTVTNASGNVTLQGWLAMWSMVTLLDYKLTLEYFGYLGFPGETPSALKSTKRRSVTPRINRKGSNRNSRSLEDLTNKNTSRYFNKDGNNITNGINNHSAAGVFNLPYDEKTSRLKLGNSASNKKLNSKNNTTKILHNSKSTKTTSLIYVVGSPGSGKSSLLNYFVKKPFDNNYSPTENVNIYVNSVEIKGGQQYLVIKDFGFYTNLALGNSRAIDCCDLLCMVYDSSDPDSFQYLMDLRNYYNLDNVPTIFIATKSDLDSVVQHSEDPPDIYCRNLKLKPPVFISVRDGQTASIFEKMADSSSKHDSVTPSILLSKKKSLDIVGVFKYSAIITVSIAVAWGILYGSFNRSKWVDNYLFFGNG
ncbi:Mitochondrial Rho GTPase 1 [Smittium culicis]|uniref:Mitochondrial Rho GTPase n=1 Tax=Smittium culicis TaxID=133412 RepID=A0A1R1XW92_9FUNG|nr:Mitochondrial Rho GTPase 1 [Smittium culicis]